MPPRRRRHFIPVHNDGRATDHVEKLAFKYMEMCKVESSTDSESDISPRWSDTSTMGCASSTPESRPVQRTLPLSHKPVGRHHSTFLDPYDGSSEDSDVSSSPAGISSRRSRQQGAAAAGGGGGGGGSRFLGRNRRLLHHSPAAVLYAAKSGAKEPAAEQQRPADVQMASGSDKELWPCDLEAVSSISDRSACRDPVGEKDSSVHSRSMECDVHALHDDSGVHTSRSHTPCTPASVTPTGWKARQMLDSSSERSPSPCDWGSLHKRKLSGPGADVPEPGHKKRLCVVNMEEEQLEGDSHS